MGFQTRRALGALLATLVGACAHDRPLSRWERAGVRVIDGTPQLNEVEIGLGRTPCFGACPVYTLRLLGSGLLIYEGEMFVKSKHERRFTFEPERLLPLLEGFERLDFLGQDHHCNAAVADLPSACLTLRIGRRSRTVCDPFCESVGLSPEARAREAEWHRKAQELAQAIDTFANIEVLIGTEDERR